MSRKLTRRELQVVDYINENGNATYGEIKAHLGCGNEVITNARRYLGLTDAQCPVSVAVKKERYAAARKAKKAKISTIMKIAENYPQLLLRKWA